MSYPSISESLPHCSPAAAAAAGYVNVGAAFLIGMIGAMCSSGAQELMERYGKAYLSDTAEVFVCHGIGEQTMPASVACYALLCLAAINIAMFRE